MGLLEDKVVVVTGAGRGIGRGEALECARQGAAVVVAEFDGDAGEEVAKEIVAAGGRALSVPGDVSDADVADGLVTSAVETFGGLDAVVNNAGILRDRTLVKMSDAEWDDVVRVHLRGHFAPTRAACRYWRESERPGHLVHTASTSGILGNFGQSNYGAAKAGIAAFSTIVAMEMARYNVTSNAIAPSALTRMTEALLPPDVREDRRESLERGEFDFFDPDNVGPFVAYLASDASSHISGKVFGVQGDSIELYQPFTSVAEIRGDGHRWDPEAIPGRMEELFAEAGIDPAPENMMARSRHKIIS
jgi:NAD(P)-dependent dehydrogenase (short-subunit alcohol dehydrogenase family)